MEMSQGNSLSSYPKQQQKNVICFSFTKSETRSTEQVLPGRLVPVVGGRRWGNGVGG
jgi:hypothetical protein